MNLALLRVIAILISVNALKGLAGLLLQVIMKGFVKKFNIAVSDKFAVEVNDIVAYKGKVADEILEVGHDLFGRTGTRHEVFCSEAGQSGDNLRQLDIPMH